MYGQMMKRKKDGMGRMGPEVETVEFTPPAGLKLDGDSGTAMVDWRMTPQGTLEILSFDGVSLGQPPESEDDGEMEVSVKIDDMEGEEEA
ncbi:MAG: hypothetical protein RJB26_918 [Pseudomonadota bacterium]|jgi:hypothetical protein